MLYIKMVEDCALQDAFCASTYEWPGRRLAPLIGYGGIVAYVLSPFAMVRFPRTHGAHKAEHIIKPEVYLPQIIVCLMGYSRGEAVTRSYLSEESLKSIGEQAD